MDPTPQPNAPFAADPAALLAAIVECSDDAIISKTLDGTITSWNRGAERLLGYTAAEAVGRHISMLFPKDRLAEQPRILAKLICGERIDHFETVRLAKDGRAVEVSLTVSPIKNASGRIVGASKILRDLSQSRRALHESEQSLHMAIAAGEIGTWRWDLAADTVEMSDRAWRLLGSPQNRTSGAGYRAALHPEDRDRVMAHVDSAVKARTEYNVEYRCVQPDGAVNWVAARGRAGYDDRGQPKVMRGVVLDITDRREAELLRRASLERERAAAQAANHAKSEFLANMSHEIRTPMTAILGYADQLLEPDQTASDRQNAVNVIRRNGAHLLSVINDILDLSRIEAGEMPVELVPCSPCQILADVASLMRVRAKERGLKFELRTDGAIPQAIRTDPTRLRQILINLVGNAIKFTEAGWVRLVARLVDPPASPGPRMRFEVVDSGIGMSPQEIAKLFHPFTQADASTTRRFGGSGLGLTISQRLAVALGGEITVDSSPGRGSLFAATIATGPLDGVRLVTDCAEALAEPEPTAAPAQAIRLRGRILLAEDGPDNQALISGYLRKAGADVTVAENGKAAVRAVQEARAAGRGFDLILMDMQMPELDGYGATAKLRGSGFAAPIVALTAHAMAAECDRCLQAGCTGYLSKPIKADALLRAVHGYLGKSLPQPEAGAPPPRTPARDAQDDDEILNKFRPAFIAHLPQEVAGILSCMAQRQTRELAALTHRLAGAAGMFQFTDIGQAAADLEARLQHGGALDAIAAQVQGLIDLMRGVWGYDHASERPPSTPAGP